MKMIYNIMNENGKILNTIVDMEEMWCITYEEGKRLAQSKDPNCVNDIISYHEKLISMGCCEVVIVD